MTRPLTLATPTMLQLRAAAWLLGTPARLIGHLVAWRWGAMGDLLRARGGRR